MDKNNSRFISVEDELNYSTDTSMPYGTLRESLMATNRWIEHQDIAKMKNTIFKKLENNADFSIERIGNYDIITNINIKSGEKIVFLDPRLRDTENYDADADKREMVEAINDLLDVGGIGDKITFAHPISTDQRHWTLFCFRVNLNKAKNVRQNQNGVLSVSDLNNLIQNNSYEVDSQKDGRQNDGHSCGVHAMDAFMELCEYGFDEYKRIYEERCNEHNGIRTEKNNKKTSTEKTQNSTDNHEEFIDYDIKNAYQLRKLVENKETLAKTLRLDDATKKFIIGSEFFDKDTIESMLGVIDGTKDPKEKRELIRDIAGNISIAMKEMTKKPKSETKSTPNLEI